MTADDAADVTPAEATPADLHDAGRLEEAEAAYRRLLVGRPADPALLVGLGDVLADAGRGSEAAALYRRVVDAGPDAPASADAYDGLAAVLQDAGDVPAAVDASRRAVALRGDADDAYRLGYTLEQMNRPADASAAYELAAGFRPGFAEAHAKVATFLLRQDRPAEAAARFKVAADAGPAIAEIHCNLAHARRLAGDEDGALKAVRRSIELKPELAAAHNVLGLVLRDRRRPADALASFRRAMDLEPESAEAFHNFAAVVESIGRVPEAAAGFERAVALAPGVPKFHQSLGRNRLLRGDLSGGWAEFDWRRLDPRTLAGRTFNRPLWDGGPLAGRTVLLTAEADPADTVQFLRYAPLVAGRGGRVVVESPADAVALARTVAGVADVVAAGEPLPPFDVYCPLMTLPLVFNTTEATIPAAVPYLSADPTLAATWAARLPAANGRRRIGLAWGGDSKAADDRGRSVPPARLGPLAVVPGVAWVALQSAAALPADLKAFDASAGVRDLADAVAVLSQLDGVVAADTAVAHLAAALGKPTWLLLPAIPDWRWQLGRADSPWYPTARLFRQATAGDWSSAVAAAADAVRA